MINLDLKTYVAGVAAYHYPILGEELPPGGAKVLLLTVGTVCAIGSWSENEKDLAWSPLPLRSEFTYPTTDGQAAPAGDRLLLLTIGNVCVLGPWSDDGRYRGWAHQPERNRAKEHACQEIRARSRISLV